MIRKLSLILILISFYSCQENPLGKNSQIHPKFHPGLGVPPKILSISPNQGLLVGGTNITLSGTGFTFQSIIKIGGRPCGQITFFNDTRIVCLIPQHTAGVKDVTIENKDGQNHILPKSFTYVSDNLTIPGFGISSGGNISTSSSFIMKSNIGEPLQGDIMIGPTKQLKVGVSGILFFPSEN